MSGDPRQDYVGPGIAEGIITILSSYPTVRVVSRTSSFVYDKPVKVQQVGQELNVNYVIEGSVKKAGEKVRVTAQLIDAVSGDHVWADSYDEEGDDIATIQDEVANRIYSSLAGLRGEIMDLHQRAAGCFAQRIEREQAPGRTLARRGRQRRREQFRQCIFVLAAQPVALRLQPLLEPRIADADAVEQVAG